MKYLLDTHAVQWFWWDDQRLGARARSVMMDPANQKLVSPATPWEVAIKTSLKKIDIGGPYEGFFSQQMTRSCFEWMVFREEHFCRLSDLPFHHRDPFDRMLVAQALVENVSITSSDARFDAYGVSRVWT